MSEELKENGISVPAVRQLGASMIIEGWKPDGTNYEIKGLYNVAKN